MTKKDYELIAQSLWIAKPSIVTPDYVKFKVTYITGKMHAWKNTCKTVADGLALKDKRFKKDEFLRLCGV